MEKIRQIWSLVYIGTNLLNKMFIEICRVFESSKFFRSKISFQFDFLFFVCCFFFFVISFVFAVLSNFDDRVQHTK